ncbi:hypothetical protein NQZ68_007662 [Dissostichus eleginoides]|nr:hypothetical protein NQZ68_007662 [Dissostichus eleginoides]
MLQRERCLLVSEDPGSRQVLWAVSDASSRDVEDHSPGSLLILPLPLLDVLCKCVSLTVNHFVCGSDISSPQPGPIWRRKL